MLLAPLRPRRRRRHAIDADVQAQAQGTFVPRSADLSVVAARIAGLIDGPVSEALVILLTDLYGDALSRILAVVQAAPGGAAIVQTLADDTLVGGLLVVHDLHPQTLGRRVERALDAVTSTLGSATPFTLDRIEDDVVCARGDDRWDRPRRRHARDPHSSARDRARLYGALGVRRCDKRLIEVILVPGG